ncbi:MAG: hypothetical protein SF339_12550 [Blastocatellia bacterium]|nr:hypothetical protein [Blastocatellia bacterium]
MNSKWYGLRKLSIAFLAGVLSVGLVAVGQAQGKRVTGELSAARHATVNGIAAVSGGTVFDRSRIDTGKHGAAIINLGKRGRIEVGGETAMTLGLSAKSIGGELRTGSALLSVPAGIAISISTEKGIVTSDGRQYAVLQVESVGKDAFVTVRQGEAKIAFGGRTETVSAGEELALNPETRDWSRRKRFYAKGMLASAGALSGLARTAQASPAAFSVKTAILSDLVNASIAYSITGISSRTARDPEAFFSTNITSRDNNGGVVRRSNAQP